MDDKLAMQTEHSEPSWPICPATLGTGRLRRVRSSAATPKPPVEFGPELRHASEDAARSRPIGRCVRAARSGPPPLYVCAKRGGALGSQIEGTQSTLSDLLTYEDGQAPGTPVTDVLEVSHYVAALQHAAESIQSGPLPLTLRLLRETHAVLMRDGRGTRQAAGEFRRTQNWIGGSRPGNAKFVPPPPHEMQIALK